MTLRFNNISHSYGNTEVLSEVNLVVNPGEITCLLGPSGGGKSTLLRLAMGLEPIQSGSIEIDGQLLASPKLRPPPEQRPIGLMFQENALFPHMTVAENVAFGLANTKAPERRERVMSLLELVGLSDLAMRYPHQLSGGQQQRIALIRALAPEPRVLLMDEPYASIDITLRRALREAARQTLKRSNTTAIMVTHDPPEAMEIADVIAILDQGNIVQLGSPQTIYEKPAAASVARLFGDAQAFKARYANGIFHSQYGEIKPGSVVGLTEGHYELVVRPNGFELERDQQSELEIIDLRFVGERCLAFISSSKAPESAEPLRVAIATTNSFKINDRVSLSAAASGFFTYSTKN